MADAPKNRSPQDAKRINMSEDYEVRTWTKHFGVTKEKLAEAVKAAGPMVKDVEAWFKRS